MGRTLMGRALMGPDWVLLGPDGLAPSGPAPNCTSLGRPRLQWGSTNGPDPNGRPWALSEPSLESRPTLDPLIPHYGSNQTRGWGVGGWGVAHLDPGTKDQKINCFSGKQVALGSAHKTWFKCCT